MSDYKLTPLERETIILWNEAEDVVYIDTCNLISDTVEDYISMYADQAYRFDGGVVMGGM